MFRYVNAGNSKETPLNITLVSQKVNHGNILRSEKYLKDKIAWWKLICFVFNNIILLPQ